MKNFESKDNSKKTTLMIYKHIQITPFNYSNDFSFVYLVLNLHKTFERKEILKFFEEYTKRHHDEQIRIKAEHKNIINSLDHKLFNVFLETDYCNEIVPLLFDEYTPHIKVFKFYIEDITRLNLQKFVNSPLYKEIVSFNSGMSDSSSCSESESENVNEFIYEIPTTNNYSSLSSNNEPFYGNTKLQRINSLNYEEVSFLEPTKSLEKDSSSIIVNFETGTENYVKTNSLEHEDKYFKNIHRKYSTDISMSTQIFGNDCKEYYLSKRYKKCIKDSEFYYFPHNYRHISWFFYDRENPFNRLNSNFIKSIEKDTVCRYWLQYYFSDSFVKKHTRFLNLIALNNSIQIKRLYMKKLIVVGFDCFSNTNALYRDYKQRDFKNIDFFHKNFAYDTSSLPLNFFYIQKTKIYSRLLDSLHWYLYAPWLINEYIYEFKNINFRYILKMIRNRDFITKEKDPNLMCTFRNMHDLILKTFENNQLNLNQQSKNYDFYHSRIIRFGFFNKNRRQKCEIPHNNLNIHELCHIFQKMQVLYFRLNLFGTKKGCDNHELLFSQDFSNLFNINEEFQKNGIANCQNNCLFHYIVKEGIFQDDQAYQNLILVILQSINYFLGSVLFVLKKVSLNTKNFSNNIVDNSTNYFYTSNRYNQKEFSFETDDLLSLQRQKRRSSYIIKSNDTNFTNISIVISNNGNFLHSIKYQKKIFVIKENYLKLRQSIFRIEFRFFSVIRQNRYDFLNFEIGLQDSEEEKKNQKISKNNNKNKNDLLISICDQSITENVRENVLLRNQNIQPTALDSRSLLNEKFSQLSDSLDLLDFSSFKDKNYEENNGTIPYCLPHVFSNPSLETSFYEFLVQVVNSWSNELRIKYILEILPFKYFEKIILNSKTFKHILNKSEEAHRFMTNEHISKKTIAAMRKKLASSEAFLESTISYIKSQSIINTFILISAILVNEIKTVSEFETLKISNVDMKIIFRYIKKEIIVKFHNHDFKSLVFGYCFENRFQVEYFLFSIHKSTQLSIDMISKIGPKDFPDFEIFLMYFFKKLKLWGIDFTDINNFDEVNKNLKNMKNVTIEKLATVFVIKSDNKRIYNNLYKMDSYKPVLLEDLLLIKINDTFHSSNLELKNNDQYIIDFYQESIKLDKMNKSSLQEQSNVHQEYRIGNLDLNRICPKRDDMIIGNGLNPFTDLVQEDLNKLVFSKDSYSNRKANTRHFYENVSKKNQLQDFPSDLSSKNSSLRSQNASETISSINYINKDSTFKKTILKTNHHWDETSLQEDLNTIMSYKIYDTTFLTFLLVKNLHMNMFTFECLKELYDFYTIKQYENLKNLLIKSYFKDFCSSNLAIDEDILEYRSTMKYLDICRKEEEHFECVDVYTLGDFFGFNQLEIRRIVDFYVSCDIEIDVLLNILHNTDIWKFEMILSDFSKNYLKKNIHLSHSPYFILKTMLFVLKEVNESEMEYIGEQCRLLPSSCIYEILKSKNNHFLIKAFSRNDKYSFSEKRSNLKIFFKHCSEKVCIMDYIVQNYDHVHPKLFLFWLENMFLEREFDTLFMLEKVSELLMKMDLKSIFPLLNLIIDFLIQKVLNQNEFLRIEEMQISIDILNYAYLYMKEVDLIPSLQLKCVRLIENITQYSDALDVDLLIRNIKTLKK